MAALTDQERQDLWGLLNRNTPEQTWTKPQINAALQAVEDLMEQPATRTQVGNAIEAAAPGAFNAAVKQQIFLTWASSYTRRKGFV